MKKCALVLGLFLVSQIARAQTTQSYLYSIEQSANVIQGYSVNNTTGALIAVPGSPFSDVGGPVAAATNSTGTILFVANQATNSISVFAINSSLGALTEISGSPFSTGDGQQPSAISVSMDNQSLYVGSNFSESSPNNGVLQTYVIAVDGSLTLASAQMTEPFPVGFVVSATAPFLYMSGFNQVDIYNTSSGLPVVAGSFAISAEAAITGNNAFLFIAGSNGPNEPGGPGFLTTLQINNDGSLSQVAEFTSPIGDVITNLALAGNFLFTNFGTFVVAPDGSLTLSPNSAWNAAQPFTITSLGSFLDTGSEPDSNPPGLIYPYVIAPDGTLTNSQPPLILQGRANQFVIANTSAVAPLLPAFVFNPSTPFNFNPFTVGTSIVGQVQIISTGSVALTINSISISGDPSFTETNSCSTSLPPSSSCNIEITFAPTTVGTFAGMLSLEGNESGSLSISGIGVAAPTVTVTPTSQSGQAGDTFTYTVASNASQVSVSCATIPAATCAINKGVLSVQTTAPSAAAAPSVRWLLPLGLCATALLCLPRRRRKTILCVGALAVLAACGGAGSKLATATPPPTTTAGTPAGTYAVHLSAASGSTKATATAQVVIQ